MDKNNNILGRGLSSLIPPKIDKSILPKDTEVVPDDEMIVKVAINKIKPNPNQPRSHFDHEGLEELTNSIKEHGILQPIILTASADGYEVIAGERRFRAAKILEMPSVPAIIRDLEDQEKLEIGLVENIQRRDLNAIEEAVAYQRLIDEFGLTQEDVARKVGKSRSAVTNTIRLLGLPTEIQKALINGKINYSTARLLAGVPPQERMKIFEKILKNDLTVRAAEGHAKQVSVRKHTRRAKDPNVVALEEKIQESLGTKVTVKKSGDSGQIIIDFYSTEDLQILLEKFVKLNL